MDLKRLTRERDQIRRVFKRHGTTAKSQVDLEFLEEKMRKLAELDKMMQEVMLGSDDFDQITYEKECDECDNFRREWLQIKTKLMNIAREEQLKKSETEVRKHNLNLPKLEIRKFDDNPKSWLAFWGQYKKIHEDKSMDAETKFQYLTQAMTLDSKARNLIESYPPTEENYTKVVQTLKDRFAKDDVLIEIYVRELLKLVSCRNQVSLDVLYDKFIANLQILESLGISKNKYECILLPMIESALPEGTLLLWSKIPCKGGESRLENLLKFLQTEVEAERRVLLAKTEFLDGSSTGVVPTASCLVAVTKQVNEKSSTGKPVKEGDGQDRKVRALLDSGSQRTYVKNTLAQELGLQVIRSESLSHSLFGGIRKSTQEHKLFEFQVSNLNNTYSTTMTGLGQDVLCGHLPRVQDTGLMQALKKQNIHLTDADESVAHIESVDILIGSDYLGYILDNNLVHVTDKLVAVKTKLGWTLQGPVNLSNSTSIYDNVVHTNFLTVTSGEDNSLEFLWNVESLGIKDPYNKEVNDFNLDILVNDSGRYEVPLLWKSGYPKVESNCEIARRRLDSTTRKLSTMGKLEDYHNIFKEWEKEGILELVNNDNKNDGHYLPHHPVIKLESMTTKIRPVFDASSKDKNGLSLNMCIEKGDNLIELIPKLIILFRSGMYGVISDIRKAFLQISVSPEDRKYLKLLWWNNPNTKEEVVTYQQARVPFGVTCSPFLLAKTIKHHLEEHCHTYPDTAARLKESFYVDNCVTSFDAKHDVNKFIIESTELMSKGQFDLTAWMTNSSQKEEPVSVLGIQWDRNKDNLHCNLNLKTVPDNITKRDLLSITQQIFDPIGFLCPVALVPKLIIQKAWLLKTGWDEKIPIELENEYKDWIHNIEYLRECKIPRRLTEFPLCESKTTIHVFCDASKDAYAGCVFMRTEHEGHVTVRLIIAKSRVAPIKRQMTLPRLELMGALIASRLYHEVVVSGLLSTCKNNKVYCWTDSAVVVAWLKRQDTWKIFVTNRVKEICTNTNRDDWNHLPGIYNPADLPSRGCNPKTLLETQWWTGPKWLYLKEENWPKSIINSTGKEEEIINSEKSKTTTVNVKISTESLSNHLLYFNQYNKIIRLVARLLRLSPRIRKTYNISSKSISFEEYKNAEETLIKIIQKESYTEEYNSKKKFITIEESGIIKVKTRLDYSGEDKDFIHPILLPGNNEIVKRMVQEKHRTMNHAGTQTLLAMLRNSYWITGVRKLVKNVVSKCIICKRYKAKHYEVPEPPLPADRIRTTAPFEVTGIDLAGPLFLKNNTKCWIVLFTCAVYRAIHLELTESLSTNSFLMALRRFIARRGRAKIIYTDNGTNFVGAANLLKEVNWQEVEESTNSYKITWKFSVPTAPWWGGWWERLIRVVKDMLRRILGKASLDYIELSTVLCDCETVINSRPLTYIEIGDVKPLTPLLFLQSIPTGETPDLDQIDEKSIQIRYKYLQQLRQDFRKRFKSEYLSLLIRKGKDNKREPKIGELVLVDNDSTRLHWPLGIVKETYTGKDGLTRVAKVQTSTGIKVRPYQRLYPLELSAVSQEWLENIPNIGTDVHHQLEQTGNPNIPVPLVSTTRSGREIKLPHRFFD